MFVVSPSILAADFSQLGAELKKIEKAGAFDLFATEINNI